MRSRTKCYSPNNSNPVVYSRQGKNTFSDTVKTPGIFTFDAKDLQRTLERPNLLQSDKRPRHKWSFMNPREKIVSYYTPLDENDRTLVFESRFESGNLGLAIKVNEQEYKLVMQNDTLTKGNTQCKLTSVTMKGSILKCRIRRRDFLCDLILSTS